MISSKHIEKSTQNMSTKSNLIKVWSPEETYSYSRKSRKLFRIIKETITDEELGYPQVEFLMHKIWKAFHTQRMLYMFVSITSVLTIREINVYCSPLWLLFTNRLFSSSINTKLSWKFNLNKTYIKNISFLTNINKTKIIPEMFTYNNSNCVKI